MSRSLRCLALYLALVALWIASPSMASVAFSPNVPVMDVEDVVPGLKGRAYTVVSGTSVKSFPVTVISVIPQSGTPSNLILIRAEGPIIEATGGIAAGMSGSPVFIGKKLIGAIGYGWNFSDHRLGLVTPIDDMCQVFSWKDMERKFVPPVDYLLEKGEVSSDMEPKAERMVLSLSGIGGRSRQRLSESLDMPVVLAGSSWRGADAVEYGSSLTPGGAIGVLLVWGDVTLGATGTLSALSDDGRFLAFGHPFISNGAVAYPVTKAWIHHVIPSVEAPFKIGSFGPIVGTVTQDRPQAIGGRMGTFAPALDLSLRFHDRDQGKREIRRFRAVPEPFLVSRAVPAVFMGLTDGLWGRKGAGTAKLTVTFEGGGLPRGWTYTNYLFSPSDIVETMSKEVEGLVSTVALNPFRELLPLGVHFAVDVTRDPRILYVDSIRLDGETYSPGDTVVVSVDLRPYRGKSRTREFSLIVPEKAIGPCRIAVRGGGLGEPDGGEMGDMDRSISNLPELLVELDDRERNNEVVIELIYQDMGSEMAEDFRSPRSLEFPGEIRRRKIKEGSMRVYRSDYYVDGSLQKSFVVIPQGKEGEGTSKETE
ncbi:MAG: SpoIVB peptidase S55 domain-containing protein [Synergistota bacterium]|nr:SpoIVB peptidase S55 domain-containing protein [Synergistota bacterium]